MTLNIDLHEKIRLLLRQLIGESVAILGVKGTGKSNTAAVFIEEMLSQGLPLCVIDLEGEYWGLREKYDIVVIGRSANVDVEVGASHAAYFAEYALSNGISLILDLSDFDSEEEIHDFLLVYFRALWKHAGKVRRPYHVIVEEAHEFVPQNGGSPLKDILTRIALRGRKRGLGMMTISQRPANVAKNILTQAGIRVLHQVVYPTDMQVYQQMIPLPAREVKTQVSGLQLGEAIVLLNNQVQVAQIRPRSTYHGGATPELSPTERPTLRNADNKLLTELQQLIRQEAVSLPEDRYSARIAELEAALVVKDERIIDLEGQVAELQQQVALLSKLELTLTGNGASPATSVTPVIDTMAVQNIHAATFTAGGQPPMVTLPHKDVASLPPTISASVLPPVLESKNAPAYRQRIRFNLWLEDTQKLLHQLPRFHRSILVFLVRREDTAYTIDELARYLAVKVKTIADRPPLPFVRANLVKRTGARGQVRYQSKVSAVLADMFPDLDTEHIKEEFLNKIDL